MRVYVCTDHDYHWPVGVASVIVANNITEAMEMLDAKLIEAGLEPFELKPYTIRRLPEDMPYCEILQDGQY